MENYKDMYYALFNKVTDVIRDLQEVQKQTEEMFISDGSDCPDQDDNK